MPNENLEYYLEFLGQGKERTGSFNLWAKQEHRYHNLATLFINDPLCGSDWSVSQLGRAVNYDETEINDELENPLRKIRQVRGEELLAMKDKSYREVGEYLIDLSKRSQSEGVEYLREKENGGKK